MRRFLSIVVITNLWILNGCMQLSKPKHGDQPIYPPQNSGLKLTEQFNQKVKQVQLLMQEIQSESLAKAHQRSAYDHTIIKTMYGSHSPSFKQLQSFFFLQNLMPS